MVVGQAVGDGLESEPGVSGEPGEDVGVAEEAAVTEFGEEESDVDGGEGEEFGELEHGVYMTLDG